MPTDKPRNPGKPPRLRLSHQESDGPDTEAVTYKFPASRFRGAASAGAASGAPSRNRLIAATVRKTPVEESFEGSACGVINGGDDPDCIGRIVNSGELVREIEQTLDRMQNRLSDFREQIDLAFRFPSPSPEDDLPPAA